MTADLIILNGKLVTFDSLRPAAEALAIKGNRIMAVGSVEDIRALAGPDTRSVDAGGNTVLPGFIEGHVHLFMGSAELDRLNLHGVSGFGQLASAVRRRATDRPDEGLIFAVAADYGILGPGTAITRQVLDQVLSDRPLALMASDHHTVWANTAALKQAGILHGRQVAHGSEIIMAPDGTATGMLVEADAFGPVLAMSVTGGREARGYTDGRDPEANADERRIDMDIIAKGLRHCASHGITTLHNMDGNLYQLELLKGLEERGDLLCRVDSPLHLKNYDPLERIDDAAAWRRLYSSDKLRCSRVKMFMDGVMESHTALMLSPYPDKPESFGEELFEPEKFNAACVRADALGLQIAVHAIGDRAVRQVLDGYEAARRANGMRDSRHRIEHIEVIDPTDLPRLAELGVVASMQPSHSPAGGVLPPLPDGAYLRDEQYAFAFAWSKVRATGCKLTFSSDWPVIAVDVMRSVQSAVAPLDLGHGMSANAQSLFDTLAGYTRDAAYMEFTEDRKGCLKPGMLADVVIMDHDLFEMDPATLSQARAALTICDGRISYEN